MNFLLKILSLFFLPFVSPTKAVTGISHPLKLILYPALTNCLNKLSPSTSFPLKFLLCFPVIKVSCISFVCL